MEGLVNLHVAAATKTLNLERKNYLQVTASEYLKGFMNNHYTHIAAILKEVMITAVDIFAVFSTIPYGKRFMI